MTRQRTANLTFAMVGPDSRNASFTSARAFVNLSGHEHYYRARGGTTLGTGDCIGRR